MHLHIHQPYRGGKELGRERRNEWSIEKASRRTQIKRSIYFLQQKLKKDCAQFPTPIPFHSNCLWAAASPCISLRCTPLTHMRSRSLASALSLIHTQVCTQAQIKFPPSLFHFLHHTLSCLFDHMLPYDEPFFDMVQLKTNSNG